MCVYVCVCVYDLLPPPRRGEHRRGNKPETSGFVYVIFLDDDLSSSSSSECENSESSVEEIVQTLRVLRGPTIEGKCPYSTLHITEITTTSSTAENVENRFVKSMSSVKFVQVQTADSELKSKLVQLELLAREQNPESKLVQEGTLICKKSI